MFETKSGVFLIAGLGFFALAFLVMGLLPWTIYRNEPILTVEQMVERDGIVPEFVELAEKFPDKFAAHIGEVSVETYAGAIRRGRRVYVAEGCWHCHSQQIRPVSNESLRWGPVSHAREYQNETQRPVLFGTRRVGPDLVREAGRRSNDWHIAHFRKPTDVAPLSVMPNYPWLFDAEGYPNRDGFSLITYMQWLGSWLDQYP
jgi:cbb3-type cytochrome c oxidase subunit II